MMRPRIIFALLAALLLIFSSCAEEIVDEPAVSASVTESPVTEEISTSPIETTAPETEAAVMSPPPEINDLSAREILERSESLIETYSSYVRSTKTDTEINLLGEITKNSSSSELIISEGNASFTRGDEKYYLIDNELYIQGSLAKYRVGGYDMSSFLSLIGESFPLSDFDDGSVSRDGEDILLHFDTLGKDSEDYLRTMLSLGNTFSLEVKRAELTVRTDADGNMKENTVSLNLSVSKSGEELMTVSITIGTEHEHVGNRIYLVLPRIAEFVSFPDLETISFYESAFADYSSFTSSYQAFEYIEKDTMTVKADGIDLNLTEKVEYAYASRIGSSIDRSFDIADGTGMHSVLTHYNNRRGFSQIDGGSIFVDTTINADNMLFSLFHPFETSIYQIGNCTKGERENGSIILTLNSETVKSIAQSILLHAGIPAYDLKILETEQAHTFFTVGNDGKVTSAGYSFAASVSVDGKTYTLSRDVSLEITSRGSAKVKVIYIEVEDEEED